ncbi:MAG: neutral ceramidase [Halioglobus sp.]
MAEEIDELFLAKGVVDITPRKKCILAGSGRNECFEGVADNIEANGFLFLQADKKILMISADVLFVTDEIVEVIQTYIQTCFDSAPHVFIASTHTHFAPGVDPNKPKLGEVDANYYTFFISQIKKLVDDLYQQCAESIFLYSSEGVASHSVNRRKSGWGIGRFFLPTRSMKMLPNLEGFTDETIYQITAKNKDGKTIGIFWTYACHPVCFPNPCMVSSEFPGKVRLNLRRKCKQPNLPVLFFQGFSGNIRPKTIEGKPGTLKARIKRQLNGPAFISFTREKYEEWTDSLSEIVIKLTDKSSLSQIEPFLDFQKVAIPLKGCLSEANSKHSLSIYRLSFSKKIEVFGFSAEVMSEYKALIQEMFPQLKIIPVSCVGSVYGYLPTNEIVKEGGYEGGDFFDRFSLRGRYKSEVEQEVRAALAKF